MKHQPHVREEDLIALVLREPPSMDTADIRNHLDGCASCRALWDGYATMLAFLRGEDSASRPPAVERLPARLQEILDRAIDYDFVELGSLGKLLVAVSSRGLCYLAFVDATEEDAVDRLVRRFPGRPVTRSSGRLGQVRSELERYSRGERVRFGVPLDLSAVRSAFQQRVLEATARIPYGRVETYGGLARQIGRAAAARAVGQALNQNPVCIVIPCHRVVARDGSLRGYRWGLELKEKLLRLERACLP